MPDIGVLASFDVTGDDELRRWVPSDVGIVTTRTSPVPMNDNLQFVSALAAYPAPGGVTSEEVRNTLILRTIRRSAKTCVSTPYRGCGEGSPRVTPPE